MVNSGATTQVDLTCIAEPTLVLGAIAGVTTVTGTGGPLAGAKITLVDSLDAVVAVTYTAADAEFVFYDVADGVYTLMASADGYLTTGPILATVAGGSIVNLSVSLVQDARTYNGTVSGMIQDQNGTAVAGCFVGLYQVTGTGETHVDTLAATTKPTTRGCTCSAASRPDSIWSRQKWSSKLASGRETLLPGPGRRKDAELVRFSALSAVRIDGVPGGLPSHGLGLPAAETGLRLLVPGLAVYPPGLLRISGAGGVCAHPGGWEMLFEVVGPVAAGGQCGPVVGPQRRGVGLAPGAVPFFLQSSVAGGPGRDVPALFIEDRRSIKFE